MDIHRGVVEVFRGHKAPDILQGRKRRRDASHRNRGRHGPAVHGDCLEPLAFDEFGAERDVIVDRVLYELGEPVECMRIFTISTPPQRRAVADQVSAHETRHAPPLHREEYRLRHLFEMILRAGFQRDIPFIHTGQAFLTAHRIMFGITQQACLHTCNHVANCLPFSSAVAASTSPGTRRPRGPCWRRRHCAASEWKRERCNQQRSAESFGRERNLQAPGGHQLSMMPHKATHALQRGDRQEDGAPRKHAQSVPPRLRLQQLPGYC